MCRKNRNSTLSIIRRNNRTIVLIVGVVYLSVIAVGDLFHICNRHPHSISGNCREHDHCRSDFNSRLLIHCEENNNGDEDAAFCPICNFQRKNTASTVVMSGHVAETVLSQTGTIFRQGIKSLVLFVVRHIRAPPNSLHNQ